MKHTKLNDNLTKYSEGCIIHETYKTKYIISHNHLVLCCIIHETYKTSYIISHNHKKAVSYMKHTKPNIISHNHDVSYMKHTKLNLISHNHKKANLTQS